MILGSIWTYETAVAAHADAWAKSGNVIVTWTSLISSIMKHTRWSLVVGLVIG